LSVSYQTSTNGCTETEMPPVPKYQAYMLMPVSPVCFSDNSISPKLLKCDENSNVQ